MPRIPPRLFHKAFRIDPRLARLLPVCRDLQTAQNELRWLRQSLDGPSQPTGPEQKRVVLNRQVARRAQGEPLQYILGTEFFGQLELQCRPGVLIPR